MSYSRYDKTRKRSDKYVREQIKFTSVPYHNGIFNQKIPCKTDKGAAWISDRKSVCAEYPTLYRSINSYQRISKH